MTYKVDQVLTTIQNSTFLVLLACSVIFFSYYVYCIEAIRLGFRDKTHAIPLFGNMYYFAHDLVFLSLFRRWFFEIDHWFFRAFWFGILVFSGLECIVHYQTLRYSHREIMPRLSFRQYVFVYVSMQIAIGISFWFIYFRIADQLYLISIASSIVVSVVCMPSFLLSRKSRKGQSLLLASSLITGTAGHFFLVLPLMSPYFISLPYMAVGIITTITGVVYLILLSRSPAYHNEEKQHLSRALTGVKPDRWSEFEVANTPRAVACQNVERLINHPRDAE